MTNPVTVAGIGDTHVDLTTRFDEGNRILDAFCDDIAARQVNVVIHTGDVFNKASRPRERLVVARTLQRCAEVAPTVVVRGNHDAPEDLLIFDSTYLRTKHRVIVQESAGVDDVGPLLVGSVAWPKKAWLIASDRDADERKALQDILGGIANLWKDTDKPRVLAMHGMISGAKTSLGQPLVGCDMEVALDDLALADADLILLGHIHLPQEYIVNGAPAWYTGSSRRTAYGEVETKSWTLGTITKYVPPPTDIRADPEQADLLWTRPLRRFDVKCERIPLPATPMLMLDASYDGSDLALDAPEAHCDINGADVRLRFRCTSETREAARAAAARKRDELMQNGAANVTIDEQLTVVSTARAPEVARATSLPEKLRMLRAARGETLDEQTEQRLNLRLTELETGRLADPRIDEKRYR